MINFILKIKGKRVALYQLLTFFGDAIQENTTTFLCFTQNISASLPRLYTGSAPPGLTAIWVILPKPVPLSV